MAQWAGRVAQECGHLPKRGTRRKTHSGSLASTDPGDSFSAGALTCYRGIMLQMSPNLSQDPVDWSTTTEQQCNPGEVCQETLLLIDVGAWAAQEGKTPAWGPVSPCLGFFKN